MGNYWESVNDIGHYGIFDEPECFYPKCREHLQKDLEEGRDFDTGWHGFKKELQSIRIKAVGESIILSICVYMDEMPDLIYDCDGGENLTDEQIELVEEIWYGNPDAATEEMESREIPRTSTMQELLNEAVNMSFKCQIALDESFDFLKNAGKDAKEVKNDNRRDVGNA